MSELSKKYQEIIKQIESKVTNEQELEFVKTKISDLSLLFIDIIDRVTEMNDNRLQEISESQLKLEQRLNKVQTIVDGIENDIYEDENYDFEIVCPYCNHEFVTELGSDMKEEIECPECHNMIELDWNEEEGCSEENCSHCMGGCISLEDTIEEKEIENEESDNATDTEEDENREDDDM